MPTAPLTAPLQGIVPPIVTPLVDQRQIDVLGLERLLEHILSARVSGIFALGTTGEGPSLHHDLRHQMVELVCDQVAGRVPVFVGITDTCVSESMALAEVAHAAGAAALVVAPPYYLPMGQSELRRYVESLAEQCRLPLMLYNMPGCCKTWFELETIAQLAEDPRVLGLKDSSGDIEFLGRVVARLAGRPDFTFLIGPEEKLTAAMAVGAHGGVHGGANLFPELYVELHRACATGNNDLAAQLHMLVMQVSNNIYAIGVDSSRIIKGIKAGLLSLGICDDVMAAPFESFGDAERAIVAQAVADIAASLDAVLPARTPTAADRQPSRTST